MSVNLIDSSDITVSQTNNDIELNVNDSVVEAFTGDLTDLTTTDKSNLVSAINEIGSELGNGHMPTYGGFNKRSVRGNQTTYTFSVPNHQNTGFIRSALVMCGDKGFMAIRWDGLNLIKPTVVWSSFPSSQVSLSHNSGTLTITFTSTVYGSVDVLFTN